MGGGWVVGLCARLSRWSRAGCEPIPPKYSLTTGTCFDSKGGSSPGQVAAEEEGKGGGGRPDI